jgi:hypothetical protein
MGRMRVIKKNKQIKEKIEKPKHRRDELCPPIKEERGCEVTNW